MSQVVPVLVRAAVLGAGLALVTLLPIASEDALGTGLLAFAGVVLVSGTWAVADGSRHAVRTVLLRWAVVALVVAVGWWVGFAASNSDASMSFTELLASDAGFIPFVVGLVLVPAAIGAAIGAGVRGVRDGR